MKNFFVAIGLWIALFLCSTVYAEELKVSILGDSYSAYEGFVTPDTNDIWFCPYERFEFRDKNDVRHVEEMWWHILFEDMGWTMEVNNSYAGSTIGYLGYYNKDFSRLCYITRAPYLGKPDLIFIFGGTNDSWVKGPVGEYKYENQTREDLFTFRPAMALLLDTLQKLYPETELCFIISTKLSKAIVESMHTICKYYKVPYIDLKDIDKGAGHPSVKGMRQIADQVKAWFLDPDRRLRY